MKRNGLYSVLSLVVLFLAAAGCGAPQPGPQQSADPQASAFDAPVAGESTEQTVAQAIPPAPGQTPAPAPATPAPAPRAEERPAGRVLDQPPAAPVEPAPAPEPVVKTVQAGTILEVSFLDSVSSQESQPGDSVRLRVTQDVMLDGIAVVPAGSVVVGTVTEVKAIDKKIGGKARLAMEFSKLELTSGRTAAVSLSFAEEGKSETKKDAATIGGAAAGGALLGRIIKKDDKDKGALIGAIVGAAAGTAVAAKTEGEEIVIPSGTEIGLRLDAPAHITVRP